MTLSNKNIYVFPMALLILALSLAGCSHHQEEPSLSAPIAQSVFTPGTPLSSSPRAQNGMQALQFMISSYQKASSIYITQNASMDYILGAAKNIQQEGNIKIQKNPDRLYMSVQDPISGTQEYYADGTSVVHYSGVSNQFIRYPLLGGVKDISHIIDRDTPQVMSAVLFIADKKIPTGVENATLLPDATLSGKKVVVVKGTLSASYLKQIAMRIFHASLTPTKRDFRLMLDPNSYMMQNLVVDLAWTGKVRLNNKSVAINPTIRINETDTNIVNPKFSPDDFRFTAPKGAQEIFVEGGSQLK
jgi:outer membrane lipoprotein-sorting protein